jgi:hypothetical protein
MSDGHWETVRGSHRDSERDPDSESASAVAGTSPQGTRPGVRHSTDVVIGWRVWGLSTREPAHSRAGTAQPLILVSTFMNSVWQPGKVMTACCGANILRHGIHAFTTSADAIAYMGEGRKPIRHVFGEVSLWGRIVIHERGYRAERAYPRRILVPSVYRGSRDIVNELRRSYGVETDWSA